MYHNELNIIAITYFLATFNLISPIMDIKIAITHFLIMDHGVSKFISEKIKKVLFYNYFRYFLFDISVKSSKIAKF